MRFITQFLPVRPMHAASAASLLFMAIAIGSVATARAQGSGAMTPSPPGAEVYFIDLKDGATVPAQLKLYFGLRNMGIAPAGLGHPEFRSSSSPDRC